LVWQPYNRQPPMITNPIKYAFMIRQVLIPKYKESFSEMGKRYYL